MTRKYLPLVLGTVMLGLPSLAATARAQAKPSAARVDAARQEAQRAHDALQARRDDPDKENKYGVEPSEGEQAAASQRVEDAFREARKRRSDVDQLTRLKAQLESLKDQKMDAIQGQIRDAEDRMTSNDLPDEEREKARQDRDRLVGQLEQTRNDANEAIAQANKDLSGAKKKLDEARDEDAAAVKRHNQVRDWNDLISKDQQAAQSLEDEKDAWTKRQVDAAGAVTDAHNALTHTADESRDRLKDLKDQQQHLLDDALDDREDGLLDPPGDDLKKALAAFKDRQIALGMLNYYLDTWDQLRQLRDKLDNYQGEGLSDVDDSRDKLQEMIDKVEKRLETYKDRADAADAAYREAAANPNLPAWSEGRDDDGNLVRKPFDPNRSPWVEWDEDSHKYIYHKPLDPIPDLPDELRPPWEEPEATPPVGSPPVSPLSATTGPGDPSSTSSATPPGPGTGPDRGTGTGTDPEPGTGTETITDPEPGTDPDPGTGTGTRTDTPANGTTTRSQPAAPPVIDDPVAAPPGRRQGMVTVPATPPGKGGPADLPGRGQGPRSRREAPPVRTAPPSQPTGTVTGPVRTPRTPVAPRGTVPGTPPAKATPSGTYCLCYQTANSSFPASLYVNDSPATGGSTSTLPGRYASAREATAALLKLVEPGSVTREDGGPMGGTYYARYKGQKVIISVGMPDQGLLAGAVRSQGAPSNNGKQTRPPVPPGPKTPVVNGPKPKPPVVKGPRPKPAVVKRPRPKPPVVTRPRPRPRPPVVRNPKPPVVPHRKPPVVNRPKPKPVVNGPGPKPRVVRGPAPRPRPPVRPRTNPNSVKRSVLPVKPVARPPAKRPAQPAKPLAHQPVKSPVVKRS